MYTIWPYSITIIVLIVKVPGILTPVPLSPQGGQVHIEQTGFSQSLSGQAPAMISLHCFNHHHKILDNHLHHQDHQLLENHLHHDDDLGEPDDLLLQPLHLLRPHRGHLTQTHCSPDIKTNLRWPWYYSQTR